MSLEINALERADSRLMATLLNSSVRIIGVWSLVLSVTVVIACLLSPPLTPRLTVWTMVSVVMGGLERLLAFRVALDGRLFEQIAMGQWAELATLDAALARLGLRTTNPGGSQRPWPDRIRGTRQLLRGHIALVLAQTIAMLFFVVELRSYHGT